MNAAGSAEPVPAPALAVTGRHRVPHTGAGEGAVPQRAAAWLAAAVVTAGVVALGCLAVDGRGELVALADLRDPLGSGVTVYTLGHVVLALALLATGIAMVWTRTREPWSALVAVSGLLAAQLAGVGIVAVRRWPALKGSQESVTEGQLTRSLAVVMAIACALVAVVCLVAVVRSGKPTRRTLLASVTFGIVVAVGIPLLAAGSAADAADRVALALMYGVPLGAALVLTAWLADTAASAVAAAVIVSASLLPLSRTFVDQGNLDLVTVLVALCAVATVLLRPRRTRSGRGGAHRGAATPA